MEIQFLGPKVSVSGQLVLDDLSTLRRQGVEVLVCNRPDDEEPGQIDVDSVRSAASLMRMVTLSVPFVEQNMTLEDIDQLANLISAGKRIHLYCSDGQRSSALWALAEAKLGHKEEGIIESVSSVGFKLTLRQLNKLITQKLVDDVNRSPMSALSRKRMAHFDVVIVGGGSAGISAAASLIKRDPELTIAVVDPGANLFYQPGWTMVGGGVLDVTKTKRQRRWLIPSGVDWLRHSVINFMPGRSLVQLDNDAFVHYQQLIISVGLELHWDGINGLKDTLGRNGVTSNYRYDLAPYTWELVSKLESGTAIFTQPPMPIKCAGAPQQAMYLSAHTWLKRGVLKNINMQFRSSAQDLFGVADYIPALNMYVQKYNIDTHFRHTLVKVDWEQKVAHIRMDDKGYDVVEVEYDMLHVCPPQRAPKCIRESILCDDSGWLSVDPQSLRHNEYDNVWGLGDVLNTSNAKTLAAVRKQVPTVANNVVQALTGEGPDSNYSGYGSCPLTVEHGKAVLAEFVYGGRHSPTFPSWMNNGKTATRFGWWLKKSVLPWVHWRLMLRGREWLAAPEKKPANR